MYLLLFFFYSSNLRNDKIDVAVSLHPLLAGSFIIQYTIVILVY